MAKLTSKERLLRAIRHEEVDRVPVSPRYWDYIYGVEGCECILHSINFAEQFEHDLMPPYRPTQNNYLLHHHGPYNDLPKVNVNLQIEDNGDTVMVRRHFDTPAGALEDVRTVSRPGSMSAFDHLAEPMVKDRSDLAKVPFLLPSPEDAYMGDIPLYQRAIGDKGILMVQATQSVDQFLMDAVGVEGALMLYHDDREMLVELLRIFQDYHRGILKRILEQGVEVVFEPWYSASMSVGWSPQQYREIFLPLIKENIELIHSYGVYVDHYNDGRLDGVLEDLAEAGVDVLETMAPPPLGDVDLASAKRHIGDRVCLKGHIDQVNLICFGTPAQIRDAVSRAVEIGAPGSGFILGTADSIRPESPPENLRAYFDAALEFGALEMAR